MWGKWKENMNSTRKYNGVNFSLLKKSWLMYFANGGEGYQISVILLATFN